MGGSNCGSGNKKEFDFEEMDKKFDNILLKWTSKKLDEWLLKKDIEEQNEIKNFKK